MRIISIFVSLLAAAAGASASVVSLQDVVVEHQYQQTSNSPCVIGDSSCNNPLGFSFTLLPSNDSSYDALSPLYTAAQIRAIAGNAFFIGVDINQSVEVQTLSLFEMYVNGSLVDSYSPGSPTNVPPTVGGGNGNGYADYILTGFTSLAGLPDSATIQFHAVMPSVNDGREEFFLISNSVVVPEPASMLLLSLGLGLLGGGYMRRRQSAAHL